jgi:hypothetical protein
MIGRVGFDAPRQGGQYAQQSSFFGMVVVRPLVLNLVLAVTACGGQVETSSSVGGGQAGAGLRSSSTGGASAIPFGTGGAETCPLEQLALAVCGRSCCPVIGCGSYVSNTKDLRNCRLQLKVSPSDGGNTAVIVNCAPFSHFGAWVQDAGTLDGWTYDYSTEPAVLVFGAAACEQLEQMGLVDVTVTFGCNFIC